MDLKQTKAAVEAMLFAHAEPVTAERLAGVLGVEEDAVSRPSSFLAGRLRGRRPRSCAAPAGGPLAACHQNGLCAVYQRYHGHAAQHAAFSGCAGSPGHYCVQSAGVPLLYRAGAGVDSSSTVQTLVQKGLIEEAGRLDLPGRPVSFPHDGCIPAYVRHRLAG